MSNAWDHSTNRLITACSYGHDWQAVERAFSGTSVLIVCRRCAASQWVGGDSHTESTRLRREPHDR